MLDKFGLDPVKTLKGATVSATSIIIVSERPQAVHLADRVNSGISQMRRKVDDSRKSNVVKGRQFSKGFLNLS